jgi:hypothetical protein
MKKTKICKGTATVEAAFIMPVVIGVMLLLLEYALMLHDEAVLTAAAAEEVISCTEYLEGKNAGKYDFAALSRRRLFFRDSDTAVNTAKEEITRRLRTALLFSEIQDVEVKRKGTDVFVNIKIRFRRAVPFLGGAEKTAQMRHSLFDRETRTRLASVITDTVNIIKDAIFGGEDTRSDPGENDHGID